MRRIVNRYTVTLLALLVAWALFGPPFADFPRALKGQGGRYGDIKAMNAIFDAQSYNKLPRTFGTLRHDYADGSWIQVISSDSHQGGGTTGVLESNGKRHFYFGHVCGVGGLGIPIDFSGAQFDPAQKGVNGDLIKVE